MSDGCCLWRSPQEREGRRADTQWEIKGSMLLLAGGRMVLAAPIGMRAVPTPEWRLEADAALLADEQASLSAKLSKVSSLPKAELSTHPSSRPTALAPVQLSKPAG